MSFKDYLGYKDPILPRLATGFGGGIGGKGSLCGALTASVMVIGMRFGRMDAKDREAALKVYEKCRQFWDRFEKEFGSRDCYALIGYHLDNPKEIKKFMASGEREKCADLVEKTARMLYNFINEI